MKSIYIDVTNIPELKRYTGISRVVSEIAVKMIEDGVKVRLIAYFPKNHAYRLIDNEHFLLAANGMLTDKRKCYTDEYIKIDELESGSVFFDCNSTWHTLPNRSYLLPRLKKRQIRIIPLIHDIIPIRFPQYMVGQTLMRFMEFLTAHMTYADDILVTTDAVRNDLEQLFGELKMPLKPIHKIGLGADFSTDKSKSDIDEAIDEKIEKIADGRKFLLTVGTVEPRKNQKILVEAYEKKLADMGISIIIVGRIGWEMESLLSRIKSHKNYNNGIYVLSDVNDATLNYLYKKAFMVVFPSYIEGYGLPTIEALINGVPIVCSDIPVMREVGGEFCDYFDPDNSDQLIAAVKKYNDSPELYQAKRRQLAEDYKPPRWCDTAAAMEKLMLGETSEVPFPHKPVKQIVFLSARPEPILATLPYIEEFMPFIKELVVCCPTSMADFMQENYTGRLKLTTVTDDELLAGHTLPPDHSTRNFFLRCLAMQLDVIDDEFIMCDDDYRPLHPITEEVFYEDGKYKGYYFSDISSWHYNINMLFSYDYCHFRTLEFLRKNGYPTLQYSSHMPQLINKVWYRQLIEQYPDIIRKGYDEWSTYFNYVAAVHREQYQPCPYVTLSWPNIGGENKGVYQPEYIFENFYSDNYLRRGAFEYMSESFTNAESVLSENSRKKLIALNYKLRHQEAGKKETEFLTSYEDEYGEIPYFAVYWGGANKLPEIGAPCYISLSRTMLNHIKIGISREVRCEANIAAVTIELDIYDEGGGCHFAKTMPVSSRLEYTYLSCLLPNTVPDDRDLFFCIKARLANGRLAAEKLIPIEFTD